MKVNHDLSEITSLFFILPSFQICMESAPITTTGAVSVRG